MCLVLVTNIKGVFKHKDIIKQAEITLIVEKIKKQVLRRAAEETAPYS